MKKTFSFSLMAVAFIATLILAGCQKDANTLRVRIDNFGGNSKVYMNGNVPKWTIGDTIWIDHGNNNDHSYFLNDINSVSGTATLTVPNYPTYCALYPYTLGSVTGTTATIAIPDVQPYYTVNDKQVVNAPMAANTGNDNSGTMTFHNLGALLAIKIENNYSYAIDVDEVIVESLPVVIDDVTQPRLPLWGSATVDLSDPHAIYQCTASTASGVNPYRVSLKKFTDNTHTACTTMFNLPQDGFKQVFVYVPAVPTVANNQYAPNRYKITVNAHSGSTTISTEREQQSTHGGSLPRNVMASFDFPMRIVQTPTGAVPNGKFSIGSGIQVYFAAGNLQYQASSGTWRIAEHQWDVVGGSTTSSSNPYVGNVTDSYNHLISSTYSGWIDLFGWGTSGYDNRSNDAAAIHFHPYDYDKTGATGYTLTNRTGYGPSTDKSLVIRGTTYENYDWGVYHSNPATGSNSYGGIKYVNTNNNNALEPAGPGATWRILSQAEWNYLLNSRPFLDENEIVHRGEHWSYSGVTYNGVDGILIYPDGYTNQLTSAATPHYVFPSNRDLPSGCVFLPESGQRNGQFMTAQHEGYYWTSDGTATSGGQKAYPLYIKSNSGENATARLDADYIRALGCAVRLVTPVQ